MLSVVEEVVSVSPEKKTRLGTGHFIETLETYYRGDGTVVATCTNTLFRFTPAGRPMTWDDVMVPAQLPEVVDQISYERVVMNAGTTWDYVPWHYNPEYAQSHGHPTIFVNTMHLAGFVDRIATDFGGPCSRVVRRRLSLLGSIYAGDSMVARGRVIGKRIDTAGDDAAIPGGPRGLDLQPARRIVLSRRGHGRTAGLVSIAERSRTSTLEIVVGGDGHGQSAARSSCRGCASGAVYRSAPQRRPARCTASAPSSSSRPIVPSSTMS